MMENKQLLKYSDYYNDLFLYNKVFFYKNLIEIDGKKFYHLDRVSCNVLYYHLIPFVKIDTMIDSKLLRLSIKVENKDKLLLKRVKRLCKYFKRVYKTITIDFSDILITEDNQSIFSFNFIIKDIPVKLFEEFNNQLSEVIIKYYNYIENYEKEINYFECDRLMVEILENFNKKGYPTEYHCDGDADSLINPSSTLEDKDYSLPSIIHCSSYIVFQFYTNRKNFIKIKQMMKRQYTLFKKEKSENDLLFFEYPQKLLNREYDKNYHFNIIIRANTYERLKFNKILKEFSEFIDYNQFYNLK